MTRAQLEHVIRAASAIADDQDLVVIGSQAILGQFPDAPAELLQSMEADVYPLHHPEHSELIDGAMGELSMFHERFGYYADGVTEATATLPSGWRERLVPISNPNTRGATGWCLEVHDLLIAKYVAGRDKDQRFTGVAAKYGLARVETLRDRLVATALDEAKRDVARRRLEGDYASRAT